jgi:hypothetical protein
LRRVIGKYRLKSDSGIEVADNTVFRNNNAKFGASSGRIVSE